MCPISSSSSGTDGGRRLLQVGDVAIVDCFGGIPAYFFDKLIGDALVVLVFYCFITNLIGLPANTLT